MPKIYTKTGDGGETSLWGGVRVSKDDLQVEAYGTLDELNSAIGMVLSLPLHQEIDSVLTQIQKDLFQLGSEFAAKDRSKLQFFINSSDVERLEKAIDHFEESLEPLRTFILPGGGRAGSNCHFARTISRRAERLAVTLRRKNHEIVTDFAIQYLNRLSDLLFVISRRINLDDQQPEVAWLPGE